MFIESRKIISVFRKDHSSLMTLREELKIDKPIDKWKKLISQGYRRI